MTKKFFLFLLISTFFISCNKDLDNTEKYSFSSNGNSATLNISSKNVKCSSSIFLEIFVKTEIPKIVSFDFKNISDLKILNYVEKRSSLFIEFDSSLPGEYVIKPIVIRFKDSSGKDELIQTEPISIIVDSAFDKDENIETIKNSLGDRVPMFFVIIIVLISILVILAIVFIILYFVIFRKRRKVEIISSFDNFSNSYNKLRKSVIEDFNDDSIKDYSRSFVLMVYEFFGVKLGSRILLDRNKFSDSDEKKLNSILEKYTSIAFYFDFNFGEFKKLIFLEDLAYVLKIIKSVDEVLK